MRKLFIGLLAAFCVAGVYAQTTIPESAEVELRPSANMLMAFSPTGHTVWANQSGSLALFCSYVGATDSIASQAWEVEVKRASGANLNSMIYVVDVRGTLLHTPTREVTYEDTLDVAVFVNGFLALPKAGKAGTVFARDSLFALYVDVSAAHYAGDKVTMKLDRHVPVMSDSLGRLLMRIATDSRDSLIVAPIFDSTDSLNTF